MCEVIGHADLKTLADLVIKINTGSHFCKIQSFNGPTLIEIPNSHIELCLFITSIHTDVMVSLAAISESQFLPIRPFYSIRISSIGIFRWVSESARWSTIRTINRTGISPRRASYSTAWFVQSVSFALEGCKLISVHHVKSFEWLGYTIISIIRNRCPSTFTSFCCN